jgi:hypothetical protein
MPHVSARIGALIVGFATSSWGCKAGSGTASDAHGFFRSENSGESWTTLLDGKGKPFFPSNLQGAGLYRAKNGVFYVSASDGVLRSPDGKTWTLTSDYDRGHDLLFASTFDKGFWRVVTK